MHASANARDATSPGSASQTRAKRDLARAAAPQKIALQIESGDRIRSLEPSRTIFKSIEFETARALRFSIGGTHMSLLWTLIIGAIAGWLAGTLVKGRGFGLIVDIIVGIVGAFIGGWVFGLLGLSAWGLLGQLCMATVGAVILLVIIKAIKSA
jgi:uncharacterized membrane protein YeaQ/YmgE (transglycosylase-associated protein family)